jgi:hypothetical protein
LIYDREDFPGDPTGGPRMGQVFAASAKSADAPDIEGGLYDAKFEGVTTKFIEGGQYGDGDRFVWNFTLLDDDGAVLYDAGDPIVCDALTSMSLNTKSKTQPKAVRFFKALASAEEFEAFEDGEGVDMDSLIGRIAQVDVAIRDNGWPTIVNVLPKRRSRRASTAADA